MEKIMCATCPHCIHESLFYWCGLERTEISDVDVAENWKPFDFQPAWCKLRKEREHGNHRNNICICIRILSRI